MLVLLYVTLSIYILHSIYCDKAGCNQLQLVFKCFQIEATGNPTNTQIEQPQPRVQLLWLGSVWLQLFFWSSQPDLQTLIVIVTAVHSPIVIVIPAVGHLLCDMASRCHWPETAPIVTL